MASTHHGVVYTKKWVVDLILDVAGYVPGTGISDKVIIEPSCGCGAFLTVIAGRLADDAIAVGKGWTSLGNAIRAYDIDSASFGFTVFRFFGIYRFRYRGIQSVEGIASRFDRGCLTRLSVAAVLVATLRRVRLFRLMPVFTGFGFSVKRCPGPSVFRYPVPAGSS